MIRPLPRPLERVLREGAFCYVAARAPAGPHVTPLVYAVSSSRLWITTSRSSVKARLWKRDRRVGGLVVAGSRAVTLVGEVRTHDLLAPSTWGASLRSGPVVAAAAVAFSRRNARFFAGYAVDAHRIPLAWSPPGRVFTEIRMDAAALVEPGGGPPISTWGELPARIRSETEFRAASGRHGPFDGLPPEVRERVGTRGEGALALEGSSGPVVLPVTWGMHGGAVYAVVPAELVRLAGAPPRPAAALTIDRSSTWRARAMTGVLLRGSARTYSVEHLRTGARSAERIAAEIDSRVSRPVLVKMAPSRAVWWRGWSSGTVTVP